jgi:death-on-curing protein
VSIEYLDLADHLAIAKEVSWLDVKTLLMVANLDLADSALHAPQAGFGEEHLYKGLAAEAAILLVRLAKDHLLPDRIARRVGAIAALRRDERPAVGVLPDR